MKVLEGEFQEQGAAFWERGLATVLLVHLLLLTALAGAPSLHEWVHHDCNSQDHDCAVVTMLSGHLLVPTVTLAISTPEKHFFYEICEIFRENMLGSFFLTRRVLEHAPPASLVISPR